MGKFDVQLDADDADISCLYKNEMFLKVKRDSGKNRLVLKSKSDRIFRFLGENSQKINAFIRDLPGYLGSREVKD